jgi:malonate-semialdehyde dehydrogenase (acetylating) / methylmalonate-semialdehyde dehydrogenase
VSSWPLNALLVPVELQAAVHCCEGFVDPPTATRALDRTENELKQIHHWISGRSDTGSTDATGPVFDPSLGEQTGEVALAGDDELNRALSSARAAADTWRVRSLSDRTAVLFRFQQLLDTHRHQLAEAITAEHGKVLSDSMGEVARGIENVEFSCGLAQQLKGEFSQQVSTGVDVHSVPQPLGVVAGITPFNFPVMVPLWMMSNAIASGNSFVLKPSEKDPSPSILLATLLEQSGLPEGVFTVLNGDKRLVDLILRHRGVDAVSFVGSTPVAGHVYELGTKYGKRVQALGGAKNHMVVLPDADIESAADAAVSAGFGSAGERCMAVSVVVAVGGIADALVDAIASRIPAIAVGPGTHPDSGMGPLITDEHRTRVTSYLEDAALEGADLVVDGRKAVTPPHGYFLGCSLVDRVQPGMKVYDEEIFGPVLSVVRVANYDEAVALVNANPYGNGVALFTRDGGAARQFEFEVNVGMVGINVSVPVPVGSYSFGGWKSSLFGGSPIYGPDGIRFYTRQKVVTTRWPDPASSVVDLGFPQTR